MGFLTYLAVREVDEKRWELRQDLVYKGNVDYFVVPTEFRTDFTSVPKTVSWLVPRYGRHTKAAVLHDYLLEETDVSRCDADGIFRRVLRELDVGYVRRRLMWAGVRWAGGITKCGWKQATILLLITLLTLPIAIPAAVVGAFLLVFWLVESVVYWIRKLFGLASTPPPPPPWSW